MFHRSLDISDPTVVGISRQTFKPSLNLRYCTIFQVNTEWAIKPSAKALRTKNPIRRIVDKIANGEQWPKDI